MKGNKKTIFLVLALALVLKLVVGFYFFRDYEIKNDAKDYYEYAQIIQERGPFFTDIEGLEAFAPPGFPWILALVMSISNWLGAVVFLNALFSTATVYLIYRIALYILPQKWALAASIYAILFVPYYLYIGTILKESLLQFLVPLSVLLLFNALKSKKLIPWIALGLVLSYLCHTDERFLLLIPLFLIAIFVFNSYRERTYKWQRSALLIFAIVLFSSPWFARNHIVYERPILITERFQSPIDKSRGIENRLNQRAKLYKDRLIIFRDSVQSGYNPTPRMGRERALLKAMNEGLIPHDYSLAERIYFNLLGYWSPVRTRGILIGSGWKYKGARTPLQNILYFCNFGILLPFLLLGIFKALCRKNSLALFLSVYLLLHSGIHVFLIFGSGRYRHPVDFIIIILAFFGFYQIKKMTRKPDAVEK